MKSHKRIIREETMLSQDNRLKMTTTLLIQHRGERSAARRWPSLSMAWARSRQRLIWTKESNKKTHKTVHQNQQHQQTCNLTTKLSRANQVFLCKTRHQSSSSESTVWDLRHSRISLECFSDRLKWMMKIWKRSKIAQEGEPMSNQSGGTTFRVARFCRTA